MASSDEPTSKKPAESPEMSPSAKIPTLKSTPAESPARSSPADVEKQSPKVVVSSILRRSKREDLLNKGSVVLRSLALLFSLISFAVMASNKHGDEMNFDSYEEYSYCLAVGVISTLYTACQVVRQFLQLSNGKHILSQRASNLVDFIGDQIMAYLLISAASAAIPMTDNIRKELVFNNIFTDTSAASISMAFLAFISLALSALISGFKLSTQSYV